MKKTALLIGLCLLMGCTSGNCRQVKEAEAQKNASNAAPSAGDIPVTKPISSNNEKVRVYKYDGSLQCGMGKAISPEDMKKELKGIAVLSATNKADGLMHIQQCGTPTGKCNVYEINRKDLEEAKKRGFKEWTFD